MSLTRRGLLQSGGVAVGGSILLWRQPAIAGAPPVEQVHLQFGSDASRSMVVSWATPGSVRRPRVRLGTAQGGLGTVSPARTAAYVDGQSGIETWAHHARLDQLLPNTTYLYEVVHDGATPFRSTFRTAPAGRARVRFTSFGDQTTGDARDPISSPYASYVVDQVEAQKPLFHLLNGDLCYANFNGYTHGANPYDPRPQIWRRFFLNNQRSAARRPWMPAAGNHENEAGNGAHGLSSYTTRFHLPDNGSRDFRNYWYAFTAGSVRVVALQNDDVCYQDGGNTYIRGYSDGAQRDWLRRTLAEARADHRIDWVVVCMHQLALSSSASGNGCDLGVREQFVPLFDRYGVDLVLCGHDHDYERSYAVRGVLPASATRTPRVASADTAHIDTRHGTVHMTLGGGGTTVPTNVFSGSAPAKGQAKVITGRSTSEQEPAQWSAVRDDAYPYGFAVFDVDPGTAAGGRTTMRVRYYRTPLGASLPPVLFDEFVLHRARADRPQPRRSTFRETAVATPG